MWISVLQAFPSLTITLPQMKSFQYLTTVIALTLLASHQAVAAPASVNQARSDPAASPIPSGNTVVTNVGTVGNQIGVVDGNISPNAVATSSGKKTDANGVTEEWSSGPNGVSVKWTSPTGATIAESTIDSVGNEIGVASGNISPTAVTIIHD